MYRTVRIRRGKNGWGGPLTICPDKTRNKVVSITGGGIDPIAKRIADLTGAELVDGFKTGVADEEILVAVVDCGGTARSGVYPRKGIFTVNLRVVGQAGPLAKYITEELYVSDVKEEDIELLNEKEQTIGELRQKTKEKVVELKKQQSTKTNLLAVIGKGIGGVVNKFYQAARDAVDIVIKNILPFMAFISLIIGIIKYTKIGDALATKMVPFATSLPGLILISVICAIPILSPILGPGAVIAQVVGSFIGVEIAKGNIPPQYALPALFAINPQVGADFIPVGLALGEADAKTIEIGVPAILISRLITGPLAVVIAYIASIGMY